MVVWDGRRPSPTQRGMGKPEILRAEAMPGNLASQDPGPMARGKIGPSQGVVDMTPSMGTGPSRADHDLFFSSAQFTSGKPACSTISTAPQETPWVLTSTSDSSRWVRMTMSAGIWKSVPTEPRFVTPKNMQRMPTAFFLRSHGAVSRQRLRSLSMGVARPFPPHYSKRCGEAPGV